MFEQTRDDSVYRTAAEAVILVTRIGYYPYIASRTKCVPDGNTSFDP